MVGMLNMAVGLFLLSRMDQTTSVTVSSAVMLVFGTELGLVSQVLVIAVVNVVGYRDAGVATSGAIRVIAKLNLAPNQRDDPEMVAALASPPEMRLPASNPLGAESRDGRGIHRM